MDLPVPLRRYIVKQIETSEWDAEDEASEILEEAACPCANGPQEVREHLRSMWACRCHEPRRVIPRIDELYVLYMAVEDYFRLYPLKVNTVIRCQHWEDVDPIALMGSITSSEIE
uniref:Uncharacterized protein n=1 Tax=Panagrolaimus superbus TaxID=310955 RepID=A0A914Z0V1_9BILA